MRLLRLELTNFRSYDSLDLNLAEIDSAVVVGPNGAGKSSLLRAIEFCLFGGSADDLISNGSARGGVTLTISQHGREYRITRGRERNKRSWLKIASGEDDYTQPSVNETQRWLEAELLGMDQGGFRASIYVPQGQAGLFAGLSASGRKELLGKLLGLDIYEQWRQQASGDAREVRGRAESSLMMVGYKQERLEAAREKANSVGTWTTKQADIRDSVQLLEQQLADAIEAENASQPKARKAWQMQIDSLETALLAAQHQKPRLEKLRAVVKLLPDFREEAEEWERRRTRHAAVAAQKQEEQHLSRQIEQCSTKLREIEANLGTLREEATCPLCGQRATGPHAAEVLRELEAQQREYEYKSSTAEERRSELRLKMGTDDYDAEQHKRCLRQLKEAEAAEAKIEEMAESPDIDQLKQELNEARAELAALPTPSRTPTNKPGDIRVLLTRRRAELQAAEITLAQAREAADTVEELSAEIADDEQAVEELDARRAALEALTTAYSRQGIPALMIENAVGTISDAANQMLEELGAPLTLRLATTKAKKTGGEKETLDIMVDANGTERPLESFSGGEGYRVNIALRMGLAAMMTQRAGSEAEFLLVDEPTDLDAAGMNALADVLSGINRQVILVTHHQELVERFPQTITVTRASDVSASEVAVG